MAFRRLAWFAVAALALAGLYLLFTDDADIRELMASVVVAALALSAALVMARGGDIHFHLRMRDLIQAWRLPWYAVSGTVEVLQGLARRLAGARRAPSFLAAVRFDVGGADPAEAGRRALVVTYTTATPNFIVLGPIPEQHLLLYHQIIPGDVRKMTANLGARP